MLENVTAYEVLFSVCALIIVSYLFSLLHRATRIPSVLMLLGLGIALKQLSLWSEFSLPIPARLVEFLGTIGLIMIVLEAGLDLTMSRDRLPLIRNSFFSALVIFILSALCIAGILQYAYPGQPFVNCLVYSIPLSIISSSIVLPSVHHLTEDKKEFLIYEASISDIIGIMVFNFFTTDEVISGQSVGWFFSSLVLALLISAAVCFGLMLLLVRSRINERFFLMFSVLVVIYVGGKMLHLPSLITILMFGLVVNNWELISGKFTRQYFEVEKVQDTGRFLKSITGESSFLIRTFFFVIFGYNIDLGFFQNQTVLLIGGAVVAALLGMRFIYLRILHKYHLFPELFYIPRGLITILLFYKIPEFRKLQGFDEGILFFVILATALILMAGSLLYKDKPTEYESGSDIEV